MRLLQTSTLRFKEFFEDGTPPYAILSHRWGNEECSLQEFKSTKSHSETEGYAKIIQCCSMARERGLDWVWVDTCCIDKTSSAELSEAINSMFRWYQKASECYTYLSDVVCNQDSEMRRAEHRDAEEWFHMASDFGHSAWFTRAWTLQELLALIEVRFYDKYWKFCGTRSSLVMEITAATGIEAEYLDGADRDRFTRACVAKKMSWVSKRNSSRSEDMAYCLLGLFEVSMPLLYGEGRKAFIRLQFEIIRKTDDESIFAWTLPCHSFETHGMLATWPDAFAGSSNITTSQPFQRDDFERLPYSMTNKGLQLLLPAPAKPYPFGTILRISLQCFDNARNDEQDRQETRPDKRAVYIALYKFDSNRQWRRIHCDSLKPDSITIGVESSLRSKTHLWNHNLTSIFVKQKGV